MEQTFFDVKSLIGAALSILGMTLGMITLQDWAVIAGIGVGITTIVYNIVRTYKELKKK